MRYILLPIIIFVISCGTQDNGSQKSAEASNLPSRVVHKLVDVPACTTEIEGALVYVKESALFKYCESVAWLDLDLSGADGAEGMTYNKWQNCYLALTYPEQEIVEDITIYLGMRVYYTNQGHAWTHAEVRTPEQGYYGTSFHSPKMFGAGEPSAGVSVDLHGSNVAVYQSSWRFTTTPDAKEATAKYIDASLPEGTNAQWSLPCETKDF